MPSHLGGCKAKKNNQGMKEWRQIYYLKQVKRALGLFTKQSSPGETEEQKHRDFIWGACTYAYGKALQD